MGSKTALGIIAGSGDLPKQVARHCLSVGRPCFVIGFQGETSPDVMEGVPHIWITLERVGAGLKELKKRAIKDLVLVGRVQRPEITHLKPDFTTIRLLARIVASPRTGDDVLFREIVGFLEDRGFTIVGAQDIIPDILAPAGVLGTVVPDARAQADVSLGYEVGRQLGRYDVGQAVVVQNGRVLGLEGPEGTDALIERARHLQARGPGGVLVKMKKPQQDGRVDLPAVGPETVDHVYAAGLRGIAIEGGNAIIIQKAEMLRRADEKGIFVYGIHATGAVEKIPGKKAS